MKILPVFLLAVGSTAVAAPTTALIGQSPAMAIKKLGKPAATESVSDIQTTIHRVGGGVVRVDSRANRIYKVTAMMPAGSITPDKVLKLWEVAPKGEAKKRGIPGTQTQMWNWDGGKNPGVNSIFLRRSLPESYWREWATFKLPTKGMAYYMIVQGPGGPRGGGGGGAGLG